MDDRRPLEVHDWYDDPRSLQSTREPIAGQLCIPARILGVMGTLLLHSLLVPTVVLGTSTRKVVAPPTMQGLAVSANAVGVESEMTLVVVQPIEAANSKDSVFEDFASRGSLIQAMPIALLSPDPIPNLRMQDNEQTDNAEAESPVASGDPEGQARLFGIYSGQIQARINRVWRRPRTPVNERHTQLQGAPDEEAFRCQARIIQDKQGNVQEILLPQCNGSAAWQRSLVIAIQQASPLPAPPSPTVFTRALTMTFTGFEYRPDSPTDDYELDVPGQQVQNPVSSSGARTLQTLGVSADERDRRAWREPTDRAHPASSDSL